MRSLFLLPLAALGVAVAAPVPAGPTVEVVADAKGFTPHRKYLAHPGTVVGVVASDVAAAQGREGRSGPPDAMGFSVDGSSYNWMYTPSMAANALITNLRVKVGRKGDALVVYPKLDMARPKTVAAWDITAAYFLAEIEVNDGKGCPADEAFVATKMKRLDGTKAFPLKLDELVKAAKGRFATDADKAIDAATWEKARQDALGDRKATGPKETRDVMYATWLPDAKRVRLAFLRTVTDGDYKRGGGANFDPPALPLPGGGVRPPPPPREFGGARWGTQFGVTFATAYEFNTAGTLVAVKTTKPTATKTELPPPPMNPRGPFPLPPPPLPPKKGK